MPRLQVLHLEDDPRDAAAVGECLRNGGVPCDITTVTSREHFESELALPFDVVLSEDRIPRFSGSDALALSRALAPQVPFVFVTSTADADAVAERLKAGAADYVTKANLSRLAPAIRQAVADARAQAGRQAAEATAHQLALTASEDHLRAILDHSPSMVAVKDLDGRYRFVNRTFERTYGLNRSQILGRMDPDLFAPRLAELYRANDQRALDAGEVVQAEEPSVHGGRVRLHATSRFALMGVDGAPHALCCIADDITDRKQAEDDVKMSRLEAEQANRAKSEFLSRMSHDLRTPLNAVLGFAQLLTAEPLTPGQRESVQQIVQGGQHLLELVNEVLDIARVETGRLPLSPSAVAADTAISDVAGLVAPLAAARGVIVEVQSAPCSGRSVLADPQRLNQILIHLMTNAVKYNQPGGRVTVGCLVVDAARIRLVVTDTGPGIPRQQLKLVFQPFERLGAQRTGVEGTGLGLTLARSLAEAMGGTLGVTSEVGRGSTFWVELPRADGAPVRPSTDTGVPGAEAPEARAVLLYVEDNVSNVRLMQKLLQSRPALTLLHAPDGETGLAMARRERPDLVLLDLHLPDVPGQEVLRRIWSDPDLRTTPVAVLSADATPGQVQLALASGAAAYLTKPLDLREVLQVIDQLLSDQGPRSQSLPEVPE